MTFATTLHLNFPVIHMQNEISILKGIHPGIVLDRKLKECKPAKGPFALSINEYPQTLGAITKEKRSMNTAGTEDRTSLRAGGRIHDDVAGLL
jgi:hypothetical protein